MKNHQQTSQYLLLLVMLGMGLAACDLIAGSKQKAKRFCSKLNELGKKKRR